METSTEPGREARSTRVYAGVFGACGLLAAALQIAGGDPLGVWVTLPVSLVLLVAGVTGRSLVQRGGLSADAIRAALAVEVSPHVRQLVRAGDEVAAVRRQRAETGAGWRASKRAVDAVALQHLFHAEFAAPSDELRALMRRGTTEGIAVRTYQAETGCRPEYARRAIHHVFLHQNLAASDALPSAVPAPTLAAPDP